MVEMYTIYDTGIRIRERREALGKSRQTMSDAMRELGSKANQKTIESWELGRNYCSLVNIPYICEVLDCDTEYLFGNSPTPHKKTASAMEVTGLSRLAVEKLSEFEKSKNDAQYNYSSYLSEFIESMMCEKLADSLIDAKKYVDGISIVVDDSKKQFVPSGSYNDDHNEFNDNDKKSTGLDLLLDVFNGNPTGISEEKRYHMLLSSMKQAAMDLYGKFFDSQIDEAYQQSRKRKMKDNPPRKRLNVSEVLKLRKELNDGEH